MEVYAATGDVVKIYADNVTTYSDAHLKPLQVNH